MRLFTDVAAGQAKLEFPTTCPLCEHSPLEADSCTVNKALRGTMRAWLLKQKKKDEKAATQAAAPTVEAPGTPADEKPSGDREDVEKAPEASEPGDTAEDAPAGEAPAEPTSGDIERANSEVSPTQEVSSRRT